MAIQIIIVNDPFAFRMATAKQRHRMTEAEKEEIRKRLAIQRDREEQHRQKLIEMGVIPAPKDAGKE